MAGTVVVDVGVGGMVGVGVTVGVFVAVGVGAVQLIVSELTFGTMNMFVPNSLKSAPLVPASGWPSGSKASVAGESSRLSGQAIAISTRFPTKVLWGNVNSPVSAPCTRTSPLMMARATTARYLSGQATPAAGNAVPV